MATNNWGRGEGMACHPVMVAVAMTRYHQKWYVTWLQGSAESSSISGRICSRRCAWQTRCENQELPTKILRLSSPILLFTAHVPVEWHYPSFGLPVDLFDCFGACTEAGRMIGRANFSGFSLPPRDSEHSILQFRLESQAKPPRVCTCKQAIFGERVLHSLSFPTSLRVGLCIRVSHPVSS